MEFILISKQSNVTSPAIIDLPASKSESNRALIIDALCSWQCTLANLSHARDTELMRKLLSEDNQVVNAMDAGTTLRFLTAYYALTDRKKVITGTSRMKERPLGILVDALRTVGAEVRYLENDGYPPVETCGFEKQKVNRIKMRGDVSSQYISALLMLAPQLPQGLEIVISGEIGSRPYIEMTLELMRQFGASFEWKGERIIVVHPKPYQAGVYSIESDWSAASYWFAITSLSASSEIFLPGLKPNSLQGDIRIIDYMDPLGVRARFEEGGLRLTKKDHKSKVSFDFTSNPDLAQTVAVTCAVKGIACSMTGLESLRIKETDRIAALQTELRKIGASLQEYNRKEWFVSPSSDPKNLASVEIRTYDDHRMAMAFAPVATVTDLIIENPGVVRKSYPDFWTGMCQAGFKTEFLTR